MQFGLDVPTTGAYADPQVLAHLAADAEAAGWDGFFIWDVLLNDEAVVDPWIALTAIALHTTKIKIGLLATPLARHRPWLTAKRLANLDHLSKGRLICTVGLGYSEQDFATFGEVSSPAIRARKLDEGLAIMAGLWGEDAFSFAGEHYTVHQATLHPKPLQSPRIPIWVAGGWPKRAPFRRAAQWDGVCIMSVNQETEEWLTIEDFQACMSYVQSQHTDARPFEVIVSGELPDDRDEAITHVRAFQQAGATWWIEEGLGWSLEEFRERLRRGPPRA